MSPLTPLRSLLPLLRHPASLVLSCVGAASQTRPSSAQSRPSAHPTVRGEPALSSPNGDRVKPHPQHPTLSGSPGVAPVRHSGVFTRNPSSPPPALSFLAALTSHSSPLTPSLPPFLVSRPNLRYPRPFSRRAGVSDPPVFPLGEQIPMARERVKRLIARLGRTTVGFSTSGLRAIRAGMESRRQTLRMPWARRRLRCDRRQARTRAGTRA